MDTILKLGNWLRDLQTTQLTLGCVAGALMTFVANRAFPGLAARFEWFLSDGELLRRLRDGLSVGASGRKRLARYAREDIELISQSLPPPVLATQESEVTSGICQRAPRQVTECTACPRACPADILMYFQTDFSEPTADGISRGLAATAEQRLTCATEGLQNARTLLRQGINGGRAITVWIDAPLVKWTDSTQVVSAFRELEQKVSEFLGRVNLVLEVTVADTIFAGIDVRLRCNHRIPEEALPAHQSVFCFAAAQYAAARDRYARLTCVEGLSIRSEELQSLKIPAYLLERRMPLLSQDWTDMCLYGAAGTVKSELLETIATQLTKPNILVVWIDTPDLVRAVHELATIGSIEVWNRRMGEAACNSIPSAAFANSHERAALGDCITWQLGHAPGNVMIIVPDFDEDRRLVAAVDTLRRSRRGDRPRFIMTSTARIQSFGGEISVPCREWTDAEAEEILNASSSPQQIEALRNGPFKERPTIPSLLLDVLVSVGNRSSTKGNGLFVGYVQTCVEHVTRYLDSLGATSEDAVSLLAEIREGLRRPDATLETISNIMRPQSFDAAGVIGLLVWFSRFQYKDTILTPELVRDWTGGRLSLTQSLDLLRVCERCRILAGGYEQQFMWQHKSLVPDLCAGIFLASKIADYQCPEVPAVICKMLHQAHQSQRLAWIITTLPAATITVAIEMLAAHWDAPGSLFDSILSEGTVHWMLEEGESADRLFFIVVSAWERSMIGTPENIRGLSRSIARLRGHSPNIEIWLEKACLSPIFGLLALTVEALRVSDSEFFVARPQASRADLLLAYAFGAECENYVDFLKEGIRLQGNRTLNAIEVWASRRKAQTLVKAIGHLFVNQNAPGTAELCVVLFERLLHIETRTSPPNECSTRGVDMPNTLQVIDRSLKLAGEPSVSRAPEAILSLFLSRLLPHLGTTKWTVAQNRRALVQETPSGPDTTRAILEVAYREPYSRLARSDEICGMELRDNHEELVGDALINYSANAKIEAHQLRLWPAPANKPKELYFVDHAQIREKRLAWRAAVDIDRLSSCLLKDPVRHISG